MPVAFHVDYWDYLGWKDPFAAKACTQRQHDYAGHWRTPSVYTPGFVLDGQEWRGWFNRDELPRASDKPVGVLTARSENSQRWTLRFQPTAGSAASSYDFHAALLGFDLISDVKAGENRRHKLEHDFVVLALTNAATHRDGEAVQAILSATSNLPAAPQTVWLRRVGHGVQEFAARSGRRRMAGLRWKLERASATFAESMRQKSNGRSKRKKAQVHLWLNRK